MAKRKANGTKKSSKAKKANPELKIVVGGKERTLKYNLYSFCRLDEECGVNILNGDFMSAIRPRGLIGLLWAGLITDDPELTLDDLARDVDMNELMRLPDLVNAALLNSMPDEEKKRALESGAIDVTDLPTA